jgi:hypothetical protein
MVWSQASRPASVQHEGFVLDDYYHKANKKPVPDIVAENLDSGFAQQLRNF